jgi:hypothetical protein
MYKYIYTGDIFLLGALWCNDAAAQRWLTSDRISSANMAAAKKSFQGKIHG